MGKTWMVLSEDGASADRDQWHILFAVPEYTLGALSTHAGGWELRGARPRRSRSEYSRAVL